MIVREQKANKNQSEESSCQKKQQQIHCKIHNITNNNNNHGDGNAQEIKSKFVSISNGTRFDSD